MSEPAAAAGTGQRPAPIVTTLDEAPLKVRQLLGAAGPVAGGTSGGDGARAMVVGVTGPVGAGKSTLALRLSGCIVGTDHYLPDYDRTPEHLRDLPESADLARLVADVSSLRLGRAASVPEWSFHEHRRVGERMIEAPRPARAGWTPLVVVEGLFALHPAVRPALDLCVYVEAGPAVRWARWERLEQTGVRGWGVEYARAFFDSVAEPTFARYAAGYRAAADVLVVNDAGAGGA